MEGRTATKDEFSRYEKLARKYLSEKREHVADLIGFIQNMSDSGTPPKSANIKGCAVRQWFIENDITFSEKQRQQMRRVKPKGGRRTNIKYADARIIREIIAQGDTRLRALVLVLASSGMRISEALALTWEEVRIPDRFKESEKDKLTSLYVPDSKTGLSRTVWITREAEEALLEWKKAAPAYLKTVTFKGYNLGLKKADEDTRLFPYGRTAAMVMWDAASKAAGHYHMDEKTHRNQLSIHRLRGFFKTKTMGIVGSEISELLLGHSDQYGNAYNFLPEGKLAEEYQRCEDSLTIQSKHGISRKMEEQSVELKKLRQEKDELQSQIAELRRIQEFREMAESDPKYQLAVKAAMAAILERK